MGNCDAECHGDLMEMDVVINNTSSVDVTIQQWAMDAIVQNWGMDVVAGGNTTIVSSGVNSLISESIYATSDGQSIFQISTTPRAIAVFINGLLQPFIEATAIANVATIHDPSGIMTGDLITFRYLK